MCHLEEKMMSSCPNDCRPKIYKRYVDDTFAAFENKEQAVAFLEYINSLHKNIRFTMDEENNSSLPFLDVNISKANNCFEFSIYRKRTFTGLATNFFSFSPLIYKINAIKTLVHRGFLISSTYLKMHLEFEFLKKLFISNGYPKRLIDKIIKDYLIKKFSPNIIFTVPKKSIFVKLPFFGPQSDKMKQEIQSIVQKSYNHLNLKIVFVNDYKISSFFRFKDKVPFLLSSNIIYEYKGECCQTSHYIGSTKRNLHHRIAEHTGISSRTGRHFKYPKFSAIRQHAEEIHNDRPNPDNFKILLSAKSELELRILESMYIAKLNPKLNNTESSYPLNF